MLRYTNSRRLLMWKYAQTWTLMEEETITGFGDNKILQGEAEDTEAIKAYGDPV